jgi:hypothetical protein
VRVYISWVLIEVGSCTRTIAHKMQFDNYVIQRLKVIASNSKRSVGVGAVEDFLLIVHDYNTFLHMLKTICIFPVV